MSVADEPLADPALGDRQVNTPGARDSWSPVHNAASASSITAAFTDGGTDSTAWGYTVSIASVTAAVTVCISIHAITGAMYLFPLLFAIIVSGWYAGFRPALVAVAASMLAATLFLFNSTFSDPARASNSLIALTLFGFLALSIALMAARAQALLHSSERLERNARDALGSAERAIVQLRQVQAITDVALSHLDLDDLLHELVARVGEHLGADTASVFLLDADEAMLIERTSSGLREKVGEHPRIPVGEGLAGRIAAERAPSVVDDLTAVTVVSPLLRERMRSALGVPILTEGRLVGVLTAASARPANFSRGDVRIIELVANRMAAAIDHAQLYDEARRATSELAAANAIKDEAVTRHSTMEEHLTLLVDASGALIETLQLEEMLPKILRLATRMIDADAYAIWRMDAVGTTWSIAASEGLSAAYLERRSTIPIASDTPSMTGPVVVSDVAGDAQLRGRTDGYEQEGIKSVLALPLRINGSQRGSVTFYFRERHEFSDEEIRIASALANLSSSAINLARLHDDERQARERIEEANRKLAFLTRASDILSASLDYEETLQQVAQLAVPLLADWCVVTVADADTPSAPRTVAVAHRDPDKVELARELERRYPPTFDPDAEHGWPRVLRTGQPDLFEDIPPEFLDQAARDDEHRELIRALQIRSSLVVPLIARGNILGALSFVSAELHPPLTSADVPLAQELARRAAIAIDNAQLYREAQRVATDLRAANAAKDEFLSLVSHELRTPITVILGNSHVLMHRAQLLDDETRTDAMRDINSEAQRLNRIIENLLVLARIERAGATESEPVLLDRLLERLVDAHRSQAPWRKILLDIGEPGLLVNASDFGIEQTVRNFLSNAEKYSPPGATIEIVAAREDDDVTVAVLDRGAGIAPDEVTRLFEPFYRSPTTTDISGVGIGLTVCKRLVEAHNGRVWAKPREGGGAEVGFALPAAGAAASDHPDAPEAPRVLEATHEDAGAGREAQDLRRKGEHSAAT